MSNLREQIVKVISSTLSLDAHDEQELQKRAGYRSIGKWTSARHAEIIVAIEDQFGCEVPEREIAKLTTVDQIVSFIETVGAK